MAEAVLSSRATHYFFTRGAEHYDNLLLNIFHSNSLHTATQHPDIMLLIGDSQTRGMEAMDLTVSCHPGATATSILQKLKKMDLTECELVAVWVGGNDATPRWGTFSEADYRQTMTAIVCHIQSSSWAEVMLVSATKRTRDLDPDNNIKKVNQIINDIAQSHKTLLANAYKKMEKSKGEYLKKDGVHVTDKGKGILAKYFLDIQRSKSRQHLDKQGLKWTGKREKNQQTKRVFVRGSNCRLSNFWREDVRVGGWEYTSGEQAYQHLKALMVGQVLLAYQILHVTTPYEAKHLGKEVNRRVKTDITNIKTTAAMMVLQARLVQHPRFRAELKRTGELEIVHNVPDTFWGQMGDDGENVFGKLLMTVRGEPSGK